MHGYFIDTRLYDKLRALAKPNEFEEFRKSRIQENIDKKRESRITLAKSLPAVNKELALKLMKKTEEPKGMFATLCLFFLL